MRTISIMQLLFELNLASTYFLIRNALSVYVIVIYGIIEH